ncbi:DUF3891 family protein [Myxacorys almedinensis]|uniref:DUF3891 family protein n=1 Tax=Myxacorys almedinensis A TaxID=2690445 RepID=A0A8J7Z467_9CYAN|nr:DUF3891 family protein [Myxacorys almedinensis]NDJ17561.1 DUF3891 family protein [Myxacorys almedinensis A]
MIVHPTQTGWQVIYHRAHALLAAQIAGQWRRKDAPPRLYETISAISHHDDLEKEWQENNLTKAGAPMDFTQSQETSFPQMRKHLEDSLYRGRWVALLTSMHMSRLNASQRGTSKEADEFLDEQRAAQKRWCKELKISQEDASSAYDFMQWCDRCSLILCQGELPDDERALEISKAHDGKRYDIRQFADGLITVEPWCFETDRFTVNVEVSYLKQIKFDDNASLTEALKIAPRDLVEWTFIKSKP